MNPQVPNYLLKALAEFLGTAILVYVGCMSCVFGLGKNRSAELLNTSVGFGLAVLISVQVIGCVSQAHINPAVTLCCLILNLISFPMACLYVVAQVLGSFFGYGILMLMIPVDLTATGTTAGVCTTELHESVSVIQGLAIEFTITGILAFVACGVFHPRNHTNFDSISIRFGLTVLVLALIGIPYTGASLNPARSTGPAVLNGHLKHLWIYWVGPIAGSFVCTFIYKLAFLNYCPPEPKWIPDTNSIFPRYTENEDEIPA